MNLHIKNKFKLIDLALFGTQARKYVKPNIMISDSIDGLFEEGDLIDANATHYLILDVATTIAGPIKTEVLTKNEYDSMIAHDPNTMYFIEAVQN